MIDAAKLYGPTSSPTPTPAGTGSQADILYPTTQAEAPAPIAQGNDAATVLYGEPDPIEPVDEIVPAPDEQQPASVEGITLDAIKAAIPAAIAEQRAQDTARHLYDAQTTFKDVIPDSSFAHADPAIQAAIVHEIRELAGDVGLTAKDIPIIAAALRNPPSTPEAIADAQDKARQLLNKQFGMGAKQALRNAQEFLSADPRRLAILAKAGDDPQVVLLIAKAAARARAADKK